MSSGARVHGRRRSSRARILVVAGVLAAVAGCADESFGSREEFDQLVGVAAGYLDAAADAAGSQGARPQVRTRVYGCTNLVTGPPRVAASLSLEVATGMEEPLEAIGLLWEEAGFAVSVEEGWFVSAFTLGLSLDAVVIENTDRVRLQALVSCHSES